MPRPSPNRAQLAPPPERQHDHLRGQRAGTVLRLEDPAFTLPAGPGQPSRTSTGVLRSHARNSGEAFIATGNTRPRSR